MNASADPNLLPQPFIVMHAPLLVAAQHKTTHIAILNLLINRNFKHRADIYLFVPEVMKTVFSFAKGDTALIKQLLNSDEGLDHLSDDEKNKISQTIAREGKTCSRRRLNQAICDTIGQIYQKKKQEENPPEDKPAIEQLLKTQNGVDVAGIVVSYLPFFKKSPMLTALEQTVEKFQNEEKKQVDSFEACSMS